MDKIKLQWEQDLGKKLTAEQWGTIIQHPNHASKCVRYKLIQLKTLHRSYITPEKMKRMDPDTSDACWHGCGERGSMMHMFWECPEVKRFWAGTLQTLYAITNERISASPEMCLLGLGVDGVRPSVTQRLLSLAFLSVKRTILMNWKKGKPTVSVWSVGLRILWN